MSQEREGERREFNIMGSKCIVRLQLILLIITLLCKHTYSNQGNRKRRLERGGHVLTLALTRPFTRQAWQHTLERIAHSHGTHPQQGEILGRDPPWPEEGTLAHYILLKRRDRERFKRRGFVKEPQGDVTEDTKGRDGEGEGAKRRKLRSGVPSPEQEPPEASFRYHAIDIHLGDLGDTVYYAKIRLGSPNQTALHVQVDTGSDTFWVYCKIKGRDGGPPGLGVYDFGRSASAAAISCKDHRACVPAGSAAQASCFEGRHCYFLADYADSSGASGFLVEDDLVLDGQPQGRVTFGCGVNFQGSLQRHLGHLANRTDGILGLARSSGSSMSPYPSFLTTLVHNRVIANTFSLCLSSVGPHNFGEQTPRGGGVLLLGHSTAAPGSKSVEMIGTDLYYVPLLDISVGHTKLHLDPSSLLYNGTIGALGPGTVFDSGFSLTNLPPAVFKAFLSVMATTFRKLGLEYIGGELEIPCFSAWNYEGSNLEADIERLPTVNLLFPNRVSFNIPRESLYLATQLPHHTIGICILVTSAPGVEPIVIGDTWLRNNFITFDVSKRKISFAPYDCHNTDLSSGSSGARKETCGLVIAIAHFLCLLWCLYNRGSL